MTQLRALCIATLTALACTAGCASTSATLPVRVLSTEAPSAPRAEPSDDVLSNGATTPNGAATPSTGAKAPRIGAPGGSGAGSRRVAPLQVQSGNETVGGLPAGTAGPGAAGLG